ncbi:hypothetical protein [Bacillus solitudinis]|uniref:hypothetical protein n=1 Tax=Bacillus solitudinis TaxID=2014074 RepID=UPI000C240367|nr:hypothetical protein [Bacillus solitudinis]
MNYHNQPQMNSNELQQFYYLDSLNGQQRFGQLEGQFYGQPPYYPPYPPRPPRCRWVRECRWVRRCRDDYYPYDNNYDY